MSHSPSDLSLVLGVVREHDSPNSVEQVQFELHVQLSPVCPLEHTVPVQTPFPHRTTVHASVLKIYLPTPFVVFSKQITQVLTLFAQTRRFYQLVRYAARNHYQILVLYHFLTIYMLYILIILIIISIP